MDAAGRTAILVRYSAETGIKRDSCNRHFLTRVQRRIRRGLEGQGVGFAMEPGHGHILLHVDDRARAHSLLARTFGVGSWSPCLASCDDGDLAAEAPSLERLLAPLLAGKSFRITCRKGDARHVSGRAVEREWGARLLPHARKVDLSAPEVEVRIDMLKGRAHVSAERFRGPGGLGFSRKERALVMMSGGFDSPVAAWKMMRRGAPCDYLHLNMGGKASDRMVLQVAKVLNDLWARGTGARFFSMDFTAVAQAIKDRVENTYRQVVLKRRMLRAAADLAAARGHDGVVTGECVGQVSSQTLRNIAVIHHGCPAPVFRPLLGEDKTGIVALARTVGTAPLSERIVELCGISRGQPVVRASLGKALEEEAKVAHAEPGPASETALDALTAEDLRTPYLFVDSLPDGARPIDCREAHQFRAWHAPGALHMPPPELLGGMRSLDKRTPYVLYCAHGSQTPLLAEALQTAGYQAYAFRGGAGRLRRALGEGAGCPAA